MKLNDIVGKSLDDLRAMNLSDENVGRLGDEARTAAQHLLDRANGADLAGADATAFDEYATVAERLRDLDRQRAERDRQADRDLEVVRAAAFGRGPAGVASSVEPGIGAPRRRTASTPRDAAMRSLDAAVGDKRLAERSAEVVENLLTAGAPTAQAWTQRWAVAAADPAYERAFAKLVGDADRGHLLWTPAEADAYRVVEALQAERAMSLTDSAGGFMVPLTLDPAVTITGNGSTNPLRQLARVVQITTDSWNGITSAGVTAEWTAEADQVADASPTVASPSVPVYKGDAYIPFSFEVQGDAVGFMAELGTLLVDAADQLTAAAYTNGTGIGQPTGVITKLAAVAGSKVDPTTAETFAAADIYKVQNALPPRFQSNASWMASLSVLNGARQLETTNGAVKFPALQDNPPNLLGRPVFENSNMGGLPNAAATAANYPLVYGDFAAGVVIADRVGSTLELVPHMFGANGRPTGQRGALLWFRTGSDVVVPNALRVLSIPTTA